MTFLKPVLTSTRILRILYILLCIRSNNGSQAQRLFTPGRCCEPLGVGLKAKGVNATCNFAGVPKDCFSSSLPEGTHVKLGCLHSWLPLWPEQYGIPSEATCFGGRWEPYTVLNSFSCQMDCGTTSPPLEPNVLGGTVTDRKHWPWQATLFDMRRKPPLFICGASLISPLHILTAAHCVEDKRPQDVQVVLGATSSKYNTNVKQLEARVLKVKYIDRHPDYQGKEEGSFVADIALLTLEEYQTFNGFAIPICLPPSNWPSYPPLPNDGDVVGFGVSSYEDLAATVPSKELRHIQISKTSPRNCGHPKFDRANQICIGDGSSGTCRGDSGGSFSIKMNFDEDLNSANAKRYVEGIVSAGKQDCTGSSVFTKVQSYSSWVLQTQASRMSEYFFSLASSVEIGTCEVPEASTTSTTTTTARPTTTSSSPTVSKCDDSDEDSCPVSIEELVVKLVARINYYRRLHNAAPLRKSRSLGRIAQSYAEQAVFSGKKLETRSDTKYGQTLFEFNFQSGNVTRYQITETSVDQWYETKASYNPVAPKSTSFTQMVWKRSERVGCGVRSLDRRTVIFCLYDPSGNIIYWEAPDPYREFKINVQA